MVFLRDWCISAKLIAGGNASRLSDVDAFFISVLVLPQSVKVEALGRMANSPQSRHLCVGKMRTGLVWPQGGSEEAA